MNLATFRAKETFITKSGNVYLRQAFLTAAQSLINHNDEYKAYYQRKLCETPRHAHKRAVSLTARKFVRLVYAMLTNNQLYMTPEERSNHNKEVNQEQELVRSVDDDTVADKVETKPTQSNKKRKSTVAATSSSRHSELNGLEDPPEQYAVNT